jgi:hypothetical protein
MNTIFHVEVAQGWLSVYMDDLAIHTKPRDGETEEQHRKRHQQYVHHILDKLEENDLYLKPEKCAFEQTEIDYLGVIVGNNHVTTTDVPFLIFSFLSYLTCVHHLPHHSPTFCTILPPSVRLRYLPDSSTTCSHLRLCFLDEL